MESAVKKFLKATAIRVATLSPDPPGPIANALAPISHPFQLPPSFLILRCWCWGRRPMCTTLGLALEVGRDGPLLAISFGGRPRSSPCGGPANRLPPWALGAGVKFGSTVHVLALVTGVGRVVQWRHLTTHHGAATCALCMRACVQRHSPTIDYTPASLPV